MDRLEIKSGGESRLARFTNQQAVSICEQWLNAYIRNALERKLALRFRCSMSTIRMIGNGRHYSKATLETRQKYVQEHLYDPPRPRHTPVLDKAKDLVFGMLKKKSRKAIDMEAAGHKNGISLVWLKKAKKILGVKSHRRGFGPGSVFWWSL